jgi:hypothetical protein
VSVSRTRRTRLVADERRDPSGQPVWACRWRNGQLHRERMHDRIHRREVSLKEQARDRRGRDRGYE